ncbi:hypothetical protein [Erythrobacter donghaensis]|uniref:hypothetical protein n=1 Tax=Erythrobacter donghaensis TaxID=267135 RepID=UPI000A361DF1|nr:hypothetical protein [Erythrobacter donghaensis]
MQKLGPEVFAAFEHDAEARFIAKLGKVLREAVPDLASEPEPAFSAQVRLLVEEARSYGLTTEQTIGAFAITAGLLGTDFVEQNPAAKGILTSHEDEFRKAELLEEFTVKLFRILEQ